MSLTVPTRLPFRISSRYASGISAELAALKTSARHARLRPARRTIVRNAIFQRHAERIVAAKHPSIAHLTVAEVKSLLGREMQSRKSPMHHAAANRTGTKPAKVLAPTKHSAAPTKPMLRKPEANLPSTEGSTRFFITKQMRLEAFRLTRVRRDHLLPDP